MITLTKKGRREKQRLFLSSHFRSIIGYLIARSLLTTKNYPLVWKSLSIIFTIVARAPQTHSPDYAPTNQLTLSRPYSLTNPLSIKKHTEDY